jgi:hypothetical protein
MHTCNPHYDPLFQIVRVSTSGPLEDHHMQDCMDKTAALLAQTNARHVLVDFRDASMMLSAEHSSQRFAEFADKVGAARRIAMVYRSLGERQKQFHDRALAQGLVVGIFASEWQALDWLLEAFSKI